MLLQSDRAAQAAPGVVVDPIERALEDLAAGRIVAVADDPDRESEIDLVMAAQYATAESVATMVRHSGGYLCAPMLGEDLDRLGLPPMTAQNEDRNSTAFALTCDAASGVTTGISAADRARTLRVLADPGSARSNLRRPGHMNPLRARPGGVLERGGHTEAGTDLATAAGLHPAAAIVEVTHDDGSMVRIGEWRAFAGSRGLGGMALVTIADLVDWRRRTSSQVRRVAEADLPTRWGDFRLSVWEDEATGAEYTALVSAVQSDGPPLVRVHSGCLTGDALGSLRCDCGPQRELAMAEIGRSGGALVYVPGHEGRGIGLVNKIRAYALQDDGMDTVDANVALGLPVDARRYHVAGQVLRELGFARVVVLTNNGDKVQDLGAHVAVVGRAPLRIEANDHNARYLETKRERMQHDLAPIRPDGRSVTSLATGAAEDHHLEAS